MTDLTERAERLKHLFTLFHPIPEEWVAGRTKAAAKVGGTDLELKVCKDWKTLTNAMRKAIKKTDGMDQALSFMLAIVASTELVGDAPIWGLILSPPSCLDGDTLIYDPIAGITKTVKKRWNEAKAFHVYTLDKGRVQVTEAMPPEVYPASMMYAVTFISGKKILVTGGHKFWDGETYISVAKIMELRNVGGHCFLPSLDAFDVGASVGLRLSDTSFPDEIVSILPLEPREYYDFHVPETENYWACGAFNHNTGKTILCEAVSVNRGYVVPKDSITGLFSGLYDPEDPTKDYSLAANLRNKTLAIKEMATLIDNPNMKKILSDLRALYDRSFRPTYRTRAAQREYEQQTTVFGCGTSSCRVLDTSEMGERFLKYSIMDEIDEELEDEIAIRAADSADQEMHSLADGKAESRDSPDMVLFKQYCGGYVGYLRENIQQLLPSIDDDMKRLCRHMAKFIAYTRARPSKLQDEDVQREMSGRLTKQLVRLAKCLGAVLGYKTVNDEVMRRVRKVVMDTARGRTLSIVVYLHQCGKLGSQLKRLAEVTGQSEEKERTLLHFLKKLGAAEKYQPVDPKSGIEGRPLWRLTGKMTTLCNDVLPNNAPVEDD